jgi:hypothetical protein
MNRLRLGLGVIAFAVLALLFAQPVYATISSVQSQIFITIIVNVTPSPVAYVPHAAPQTAAPTAAGIVAATSLRRATPSLLHSMRAEALQFDPGGELVAQQKQGSVLVQAEVSPNPKATILISNVPVVTVNQIAGTTVQYPCAFTVTVNMATSWILDEGLSNDFSTAFKGGDLANNTYLSAATPLPTSTPYAVYADDGSKWTQLNTGTAITTYCVTLTLTIPAATTGGTYNSNAVYTLYN